MFKKLHSTEELSRKDAGEKTGRTIVFCVGLGLAVYSHIQGFSYFVTVCIIAGFLFMAMEVREEE